MEDTKPKSKRKPKPKVNSRPKAPPTAKDEPANAASEPLAHEAAPPSSSRTPERSDALRDTRRGEGSVGSVDSSDATRLATPDGVRVRSEALIAELEQQLHTIVDDLTSELPPSSTPPPPSFPPSAVPPPPDSTTVFDTARDLLTSDFYLRRWGRIAMRNRSEDVDDFGYDPAYDKRVKPFFDFLYERWFRVECRGTSNVPGRGRCMLVANHSGTIPFDGPMLKAAVKREHAGGRDVRWLAEDFVFHFPFLGSFESRIGAVRACQENAERLLRQEALVAVFPEGTKGIGKLFRDRYKLQRFGRGGFIRLALRTQTPIVPVAIVGAEETNPMLLRVESFSKLLGVPYVPVTATFPLLGPLGLLPAPTKWKIVFGPPLDLAEYGPENENDEMLVSRLAETVRQSIQELLDAAVRERKSVLFG